jgi:hypothetical protein
MYLLSIGFTVCVPMKMKWRSHDGLLGVTPTFGRRRKYAG